LNNEARTFYAIKYGKPTPESLSELSQTEYGRFAIIHWAQDIVKSYRGKSVSYQGWVKDILRGWLPNDLDNPYTEDDTDNILLGLCIYDEDNQYKPDYPNFDEEVYQCFIDWICVSAEMFNE